MPEPTSEIDPRAERCERNVRWDRSLVELILLAVVVGLTTMIYWAEAASFVVLNLFFLPVSLAGFFLGRRYACNTALFCFLVVVVASWTDADLPMWLGLGVWGAVLGLQALIIGTLSDEHQREVVRLREMHRTDTLSDALTGVANRRAFEYELNRRLSDWNRQRTPLTLMLIDIDHFKRLNDTHGHQAGDKVLHQVARIIEKDCRETDLVARYGGEEFAIVMPNTPSVEAMKVAERARCSVESNRFDIGNGSVKTTISIGLAQFNCGEERMSLVQRADVAMYTSKQEGRNCSHFHDGDDCVPFGASSPRGRSRDHRKSDQVSEPYAEKVTGLPSRRVFVDELRRRLSEANRYDSDLSVILVHLDELSEDPPLMEEEREQLHSIVAEHAKVIMRDSDLVAHFDDEQLAILCPATCCEEALTPARRICERVAQSRGFAAGDLAAQATVSIGLAGWTRGDTVATVLNRAEEALRAAMHDGGNRVATADNGMLDEHSQADAPRDNGTGGPIGSALPIDPQDSLTIHPSNPSSNPSSNNPPPPSVAST